jgi:hypothetical protein
LELCHHTPGGQRRVGGERFDDGAQPDLSVEARAEPEFEPVGVVGVIEERREVTSRRLITFEVRQGPVEPA